MTVKNKWTNMSKNKRNFIITELLLGVLLVIGIGFIAYNKLNEKPERIAVVMADVDESHSAAFKYGMKMAASEYGVDVVMISKENLNNMSDEIDVINQEINKKADAVVFKPTAEKMTEEKSLNTLIRINKKTPIMVVGDQAGSESFKSLNTVEFDQYSMGAELAQKLIADNNGTLSGKKIGIYLSYKHEVDTWKLIEEFKTQKEFYVPIVRGKEMYFTLYQDKMIKNKYGIDEPIDKQEINKEFLDLMIVPLVGYDANCYRLGYGGGYYDKYISKINDKCVKLALAYELQIVENIKSEIHDIKVDFIITNK